MKFLKNKNFWEAFILTAIVLVIIQTFLDEYSRYAHWSVASRNFLLIAGFCFDLLFSIEFTVRSILSRKSGGFLSYVKYERGWVDFLSSFPLLIFDSIPSVYLLLAAGGHEGAAAIGVLNVLKVVKAIRVTRILRLVRIVKIFGKIHNAESKMAQHHTASVATIAAFSVVIVLMFFSVFTDISGGSRIQEKQVRFTRQVNDISELSAKTGVPFKELNDTVMIARDDILKIIYDDGATFGRISDSEFKASYDDEDYLTLPVQGYTYLLSIAEINSDIALQHMQNFVIIICVVLGFMFIYTRHFVQSVSDVIHVMNRGFRKKDYNLQVRISPPYRDEEIFRLAEYYNDYFLPAKLRQIDKEESRKNSSLSMNDLMNFNK